jgi:predicted CXXCH cytochrome family protein
VAAGLAWGAPESQCVRCHSYAVRREWLNIVPQWRRSAHAAQGVGCESCHGGNPRGEGFKEAMYNVPGFTATWAKRDIPAMCARCHADPARMRPYGIPTDQYDQYRQSVHGKRLLEHGDGNVAACTDCHGVHEIRAPDDPKSAVFKPNIPKLCAGCHANKGLMARYGLAADEYDLYVKSVHGVKLLQQQVRSVPACPDCHGAHGATPPGVAEVPAVCGKCHAATEGYFNAGAHAAALQASGKPRCVNCHGSHGIEMPTDDMLVGGAPGHCGGCHARGTTARMLGERYYAMMTNASKRLHRATRLVDAAQAAYMDVGDLRPDLQRAYTGLTEARAVQHRVALPPVAGRVARAEKITASVRRAALTALADARRRRHTVLAMAALALFGAAALWLKRRQVMGAQVRGE